MLSTLLVMSLISGCFLADAVGDDPPNIGRLGVYVDTNGDALLMRESCDDLPPGGIAFYQIGEDGSWDESALAVYGMDAAVVDGWWEVPLFDLEAAGYELVEGEPITVDALPFRVRVSRSAAGGAGWGALVVDELPPDGWTLAVGGHASGELVEGYRPPELACS
jgi:hypothetical protein